MIESNAYQELENKVTKQGLCTIYGACVGMCPYFVAYKGKIILRDVCDLSQGRCSGVCPRLECDIDSISQTIFGVPYAWADLGTIQQVLMARSTDAGVKARAQYGGGGTALTSFALDYLSKMERDLQTRGLSASRELRFGSAAEEIITFADDTDIDPIAMSTHGRSGVGRWVFGSATDKVLHTGDTPVLTVRARRS